MSAILLVDYNIVDVSAYKDYKSHSCRDVLMKDIDDVSYTGELRCFTSAVSVLARLEQVYVKILRLVDHAATLKTTYNSFQPCARLPPEILQHIFASCTNRHTEPRRPNWLAFSQVCTRWRRFALSHPPLWTDLDWVGDRQLAELMVARANTLPVSVETNDLLRLVQSSPPADVKALALNLSNKHHWSNVGLTKQYFAKVFPSMEALTLVGSKDLCPDQYDMEAFSAPRLRDVTLRDWFLKHWDASFLCGLTHLELGFSVVPRGEYQHYMPTFSATLAVLANNPRLISLVLTDVVAANDSPTLAAWTERVALPCLEKFQLSDLVSNVTTLLNSLVLSAATHVQVTPKISITNDAAHFHSFFATLADVFHDQIWTTLCIDRVLSRSKATMTIADDSSASLRRVELVCHSRGAAQMAIIFDEFFTAFPLGALSTLEVRMLNHVAPTDLKSFWGAVARLPALATLTIRCGLYNHELLAVCDIADLLCSPATEFSALRDVAFMRVDFADQKEKGARTLEALSVFEEYRRGIGKPVDVLLQGCILTDAWRVKLERYMRIVKRA